jgi:hypothetical protein
MQLRSLPLRVLVVMVVHTSSYNTFEYILTYILCVLAGMSISAYTYLKISTCINIYQNLELEASSRCRNGAAN